MILGVVYDSSQSIPFPYISRQTIDITAHVEATLRWNGKVIYGRHIEDKISLDYPPKTYEYMDRLKGIF